MPTEAAPTAPADTTTTATVADAFAQVMTETPEAANADTAPAPDGAAQPLDAPAPDGVAPGEAPLPEGEDGSQEPGFVRRMNERRARQNDRHTQELTERDQRHERQAALYEKRIADLEKRQTQTPADPLAALAHMARERGVPLGDFYQQLGERLVSGAPLGEQEPANQNGRARESKVEQELRELREQYAKDRQQAQDHHQLQVKRQHLQQGVAETVRAAQSEQLPWIEHANPVAVERKAAELWHHALFVEPDRFSAGRNLNEVLDEVLEGVNEHFTMVHASQMKASGAAPPKRNGNGRPKSAGGAPPRASEASAPKMSEEERAQRARQLFHESLSSEAEEG